MLPHPQPYFMYFINLANPIKNQKPVATATLSVVTAIVLTTFDEDEYVFGRFGVGAKGCLLKDALVEELVSAIAKAGKGKTIRLTVALRFVNRL